MHTSTRERVYIAGPFSAETPVKIGVNVALAELAAADVMLRGHFAHCPHAATFGVHDILVRTAGKCHEACAYSNWMALDFTIIERWATALYLVGESPGALLEVKLAESIGIPVWRDINEVPYVEGWDAKKDARVEDCDRDCDTCRGNQ